MIKKVIHISDVHIRNFQRHEEYAEQLSKLMIKCQEIAEPYEKDEVRIVICGDLAHSKNDISNELITFISIFIRQLEQIAKVLVISGNHDLVLNNLNRKDTLTCVFETAAFDNAVFLDYELDYKSGFIIDDNITWALYSIYDGYNKPNLIEAKETYVDNTIIGLYHGMIVGCQLSNGQVSDNGTDGDIFEGCDFVMAGDIHKRQVLKRKGVDVVYSGSLIQQTFGETITQHGFCSWDIEAKTYQFIDLESDYGLYKMEIKNFDDIDNDNEVLINY